MKFSKYFVLTKAGIKETLDYKLSLYVTFFGNIIYLIITYYLWIAIFSSVDSDVIKGMTQNSTIAYVVLAATIGNCLEVYVVWDIGRSIQSGQIITDILKPMKYKTYMFYMISGKIIIKFLSNFLPVFAIIYFITDRFINIGLNSLFFLISFIFGSIINYYLNFIIGTICLYTESIWGINIMKTVVISLLSGMTIPLSFFPHPLDKIALYLPFQAVCNTPLNILLDMSNDVKKYLISIAFQLLWIVLLKLFTDLFWNKSVKVITVNGG